MVQPWLLERVLGVIFRIRVRQKNPLSSKDEHGAKLSFVLGKYRMCVEGCYNRTSLLTKEKSTSNDIELMFSTGY